MNRSKFSLLLYSLLIFLAAPTFVAPAVGETLENILRKKKPEAPPAPPAPAVFSPDYVKFCDRFNAESAAFKFNALWGRHLGSASEVIEQSSLKITSLALQNSNNGEAPQYTKEFVGGFLQRTGYAADALQATKTFLVPGDENSTHGYARLQPTIKRNCDIFETQRPKMVHALGTMARAHFTIYPKLKRINGVGLVEAEAENPWTGLFSPKSNKKDANSASEKAEVPVLIRFSIANPVGFSLDLPSSGSLSLEFIPGIGLKFLVDGQKNVDLIAMESLAGQGNNHNFFSYDFSPDFSGHAPPDFMTSTGDEKAIVTKRYNSNLANKAVMNLVGQRFFQVLPLVYDVKLESIDPHSSLGPNPFIISLQNLASVDKFGRTVPEGQLRQPWRLIFRPALDNVDAVRKSKITDATPYLPGKLDADFRVKLSHLKSGDRIYYVIAETAFHQKYLVGELVLESTPFPSAFADREYFVLHELEFNRVGSGKSKILNPEAN